MRGFRTQLRVLNTGRIWIGLMLHSGLCGAGVELLSALGRNIQL